LFRFGKSVVQQVNPRTSGCKPQAGSAGWAHRSNQHLWWQVADQMGPVGIAMPAKAIAQRNRAEVAFAANLSSIPPKSLLAFFPALT
jgi:hypothetical protein